MIAFVLRRVLASIGVLIAVGLIAFAMFRYRRRSRQPDGRGSRLRSPSASNCASSSASNQPVLVQAARFLVNAARLDFGVSYQFKQPVADADRASACRRRSNSPSSPRCSRSSPASRWASTPRCAATARSRKLFQALSLIGISLPTFLIGMLLIYLFAVILRWLPSFGRGDVVRIGSWWTTGLLTVSGLKSLIMPAITLALFQMTLIMRLVRAEMLEVLRADYIRFARARGLSDRAVHFHHALRNTLVPVMTVVGLQLGSIVAFSIITETVFAWPGMGQLFLQSIQNVDIPIMAAYLLLIAALFVTHQSDRRSALCRRRSAPARPTAARRPDMSEIEARRAAPSERRRPLLARLSDNDLLASFLSSPITVAAGDRRARSSSSRPLLAPWIAPHNPFDPATNFLADSLDPPRFVDGGDPRFLLGTDDQGRDMFSAILYGLRVSLAIGVCSVALGGAIGVTLG